MAAVTAMRWLDQAVLGLAREMRLSYLPPLMVYLAAGIAGLTGIVGTFFIKDYLNLSAAFVAGLGFWVGIPWALKMPLGHLVDLIWRWKALLVYAGAALIVLSLGIMYALIMHREMMVWIMPAEAWFVTSALLSPTGYVIQDVVADAMTVEAVPLLDEQGEPLAEADIKRMHTTMQTLGRIALISGVIIVALLNIGMFANVEALSEAEKVSIYGRIYLIALTIPAVSVLGVSLGPITLRRRERQLRAQGVDDERIAAMLFERPSETKPNWWIFGGSGAFAAFTLIMGLSKIPLAQEIIFFGSMAIILFLLLRLLKELPEQTRMALLGTAIIIFIFRAVPAPGAGVAWFEIDILGFDQRFLSILTLITSCLALTGMILLRPYVATRTISEVVAVLTIAGGLLMLPNIGLYYGLHEWTAPRTGGVVDAEFIAILDTALESPLGQIAMIPMLAWIAQNAPSHLKATFFAVMASFTNLALSASSLGTKYLNRIFEITREVRDRTTNEVTVAADYSELGWLLITVVIIGVALPITTIVLVQRSRLRTTQ